MIYKTNIIVTKKCNFFFIYFNSYAKIHGHQKCGWKNVFMYEKYVNRKSGHGWLEKNIEKSYIQVIIHSISEFVFF